MSAAEDFLQAQLDAWEGAACPYCGDPAEPWYVRILSTFSFQCSACDQVIEGFELYVDDDGEPYTHNHQRWMPDDGEVGKPYRVWVE